MKTKLGLGVLCGLGALFMSMAAQAEVMLGADIELDTTMTTNSGGSTGDVYNQGGRVLVTASGKKEGESGGYVEAKGQVLVKVDGTTGVDDAWVKLGMNQFGVKLGRFEAMELFAKGPDTIYNVIGNTHSYGASAARGRFGADGVGAVMFDYAPTDNTKFELNTVWGTSDAVTGYRPAVSVGLGNGVTLGAGYDYLEDGDDKTKGYGLTAAYSNDAMTVKGSVANGKNTTNGVENWKNTSYNVNVTSGPFGIGYTSSEDDGGDSASTIYGRYQMFNLMGVKDVTGTLAFSAAEADSAAEDELAVRYRINYAF